MTICKLCNAEDSFIHDIRNAQIVCEECGFVTEESMIDDRAEWAFAPDENNSKDPSRCGAPVVEFFEKSSLSTKIGGRGNSFMKKLHNQMSMDYVERARYKVFGQIEKWGKENGNLSQNIINQAKDYYVKMNSEKISRGNVRKGLIACCIMYACKFCGVPRSVKEISNMTSIEISIINKAEKKFEILMQDYISPAKIANTTDLCVRFVNMLELENKQKYDFIKIITKQSKIIESQPEFIGKTPSAITAGLIYWNICKNNLNIDKKNISSLYKISNVTLNKIFYQIENILSNNND